MFRIHTSIETMQIGGRQKLEEGENAEHMFNGNAVSFDAMKMFGNDGGGDYTIL